MVVCMVERKIKRKKIWVDFNTSLNFFKNSGTEEQVSEAACRWAALVSFPEWLLVLYMLEQGETEKSRLSLQCVDWMHGTSLSLRPYILHLHPRHISPAPSDQVSLLVESNFTVL